MPDFLVEIISTGSGSAAFDPDQSGVPPGGALLADKGDLVHWRNLTNQVHQPWPTDEAFVPLPDSDVSIAKRNYLSDPIPPNRTSADYSLRFPKGGAMLRYCCKLHPEEHGVIKKS